MPNLQRLSAGALASFFLVSCLFASEKKVIPINEAHRFEISPCKYLYNGKEFRLGGDIQSLVEVFGPYDRYSRHAYVWDSIGVSVLAHYRTEKTTVITICFDCCTWTDPSDKDGALPKGCFKKGILVDGVAFGDGKKIPELEKELQKVNSEVKFNYWKIMTRYNYENDCGYDERKSESTFDQNHNMSIRPNTDSTYSMFSLHDSREHKRYDDSVAALPIE